MNLTTAEYAKAFAEFRAMYPEYRATQHLDELRATDFARKGYGIGRM